MLPIIIDCNNWCSAMRYSLPKMFHDDNRVEIIYGFLMQMPLLAARLESNDMIFCWDTKPTLRRDLYQDYKKSRITKQKTETEKAEDFEFRKQLDKIKKSILPTLQFPNSFYREGYEADDIIAYIVKLLPNGYSIVVANDNDLYQLLDLCSIYHKNSLFTEKIFTRKYGIKPSDWAQVKAIAGCSTDDVKGIEGVGLKTAIRYITNTLPSSYSSYKKIISLDGEKVIERNLKLVQLPFDYKLGLEIYEPVKINKKVFMNLCNQYNFKSLLIGKVFELWSKWFLE